MIRVTDNGVPVRGDEETITVTVTASGQQGPQVLSFSLINAGTEQVIQTIEEGATLNLATLPTKNLNIRANTNPAVTGSVAFSLSGKQVKNVTESSAPYALFGDNNGNYNAWTPGVGTYVLKATPYASANGGGTAGIPLIIGFNVVNQAVAPAASRLAMSQYQGVAISPAGLTAYPNPSGNGQFKVHHAGAFEGEVSYTLVSVVGKKLAGGKVTGTDAAALLEFDFSRQMPAIGVYYLHLESKKAKAVLKLMRQ
jgi:hypothetical protein